VSAGRLVADPGSIEEIGRAIADRRIDPVGLLESALRRIEAVEKEVRGWCLLDPERALAQAQSLRREAEAGRLRGPLHGVPVAVKDVIDVAGLPTRAGSATRAHIPPSTIDAYVVTLLRTAGAVILGKAHTTEFAYFDGPPPTRNPHNVGHTPGGSSAGPAAVVAAGMVPLSLGTQTAGSVNRPAAYCGIAAFKPSTRAWSRFGVVPFAPSFDTVGVFGHRVADAVAAARVLMPAYLCDRPRLSTPSPPTVGFIDDLILSAASAAVADTLREAADKLRGSGVRVNQCVSPVPFADIVGWHKTMIEYEVARAHPSLEHAAEASAGLREAACRALDAARERFRAATAEFQALIFPTAPDAAPAGMKTGDPRFIVPFTALGGPIVSIPVGIGAHGLPLGLMLIGAPGRDAAIADMAGEIARAIERPR
jgi:aspartyl-tRNA(Asn)/glutamyl-tRNA(Gln) amidotransferase subunit A